MSLCDIEERSRNVLLAKLAQVSRLWLVGSSLSRLWLVGSSLSIQTALCHNFIIKVLCRWSNDVTQEGLVFLELGLISKDFRRVVFITFFTPQSLRVYMRLHICDALRNKQQLIWHQRFLKFNSRFIFKYIESPFVTDTCMLTKHLDYRNMIGVFSGSVHNLLKGNVDVVCKFYWTNYYLLFDSITRHTFLVLMSWRCWPPTVSL